MSASPPLVLVLAAGLGTRMKSRTVKVLHPVAGRPLVLWPIELARALPAARIVCVLGHQHEAVRALLDARYGAGAVAVALQDKPRGTGDAVRQALPALSSEPDDAEALILYGDVPLLRRETVVELCARKRAAPLALLSTRPVDPRGYGRLVRDAGGRVVAVVEDKDASPDQQRIGEVNAGVYAVTLGFLRGEVAGLSAENAQGELYLTDLVARAAAAGEVPTLEAPFDEVAGVNDRVELARLDALCRRRVVEGWMRAGVTVHAPDSVSIDADLRAIGEDSVLHPGVSLRGHKTRIGARVTIDQGSIVSDSTLGDEAQVLPYSVLEDTEVGAGARVGPFAHCRQGTVLAEGVHVGNFVETKKVHLGPFAKANHLSYLGDAQVGARVNVGAGTITCNYDGQAKHRTIIEDGAFIGSDTQLVAPVTVGKDAVVAAGTTVTEDVPPGALAISRTRQVNVDGYAARRGKK
jgi:bifunctional UDP-N-acetylglucosamine pyrophosphorylase/glucosamine-1-phosphate N-acetyltransferase